MGASFWRNIELFHRLINRPAHKPINIFRSLPNLLLTGNTGRAVAILGPVAAELRMTATLNYDLREIRRKVRAIRFIRIPIHHTIFGAIDGEHPEGGIGQILGGIGRQQSRKNNLCPFFMNLPPIL
jgi:hypothetical protein